MGNRMQGFEEFERECKDISSKAKKSELPNQVTAHERLLEIRKIVPQLYKISDVECKVIEIKNNSKDIEDLYELQTNDFLFVHINANKSSFDTLKPKLEKKINLSKVSIIFISEAVNFNPTEELQKDFFYITPLTISTIFDKKNRPRGGGVRMLIRKDKFNNLYPVHLQIEDFKLKEKIFVQDLPLENSDHLWVKLPILNIAVGVVYRHLGDTISDYNKFAVDFVRIIHKLIESGLTFYIFGDFNIDLLENNIFNKCFCYSLCSLGCKELINKPTRCDQKKAGTKNKNTTTLIDHIYTNDTKGPDKTGIIISDISDHYPTFCTFKHGEVSSNLEDILQGLFVIKRESPSEEDFLPQKNDDDDKDLTNSNFSQQPSEEDIIVQKDDDDDDDNDNDNKDKDGKNDKNDENLTK